ncbi:hypothetical protein BDB00DRAFT_815100 [Zychaea mexicana]|uniref:uncharacterized protein n=1 Tax=Zychaea mexicana TaxID=64656 RepID=UPI0022FEF0BF|nr:uncharacterized protein BDB00DRAFT_815100 [Zychaea mexicana]KAI9495210.1 hypothetical protein BDB00DRAFT_815100 [Zychaea mexicana]
MSDQNNQSPINPANIANRKIAQPRRRLQRTASEDTANHSNPMAGFSFGNTAGTTPQQPSAFGMSTGGSPFGAQPQQQQPTTPTLGRSFSAASSFQFNMPQQQQQQLTQQTGTPPPAGGSPLLASTGGFGSGSSTSGSSNSGSFTFGSGATSIPSPQVAFSFGGSPASAANPTSTAGTQPSFSFGTAAASPAPQQQPAFGFGTASSAASTTTSQPAFGFGTSTPAAQSAFGSSSTQQQSNAMEDESMDKGNRFASGNYSI